MNKLITSILFFLIQCLTFSQSKMLIPMDLTQTDHLKAYGITFNSLKKNLSADWLLNYRGGSFMLDYSEIIAIECRIKNVGFEFSKNTQWK